MKNYAGRTDADAEVAAELEAAGITVARLPESMRNSMGEVKTIVTGELHGWAFERKWYYWNAEGPGIPCEVAEQLYKEHGNVVRLNGDAGSPSPRRTLLGLAAGRYHIDSQDGLNALAHAIRTIVARTRQQLEAVA
jgi:hypothetical protein